MDDLVDKTYKERATGEPTADNPYNLSADQLKKAEAYAFDLVGHGGIKREEMTPEMSKHAQMVLEAKLKRMEELKNIPSMTERNLDQEKVAEAKCYEFQNTIGGLAGGPMAFGPLVTARAVGASEEQAVQAAQLGMTAEGALGAWQLRPKPPAVVSEAKVSSSAIARSASTSTSAENQVSKTPEISSQRTDDQSPGSSISSSATSAQTPASSKYAGLNLSKRHLLGKLDRPKSSGNTLFTGDPVEAKTDLAEIQSGKAVRKGETFTTSSNRVWGIHGNSVHPISGPDVIPVDSRQYKLIKRAQTDGMDAAMREIDHQFKKNLLSQSEVEQVKSLIELMEKRKK